MRATFLALVLLAAALPLAAQDKKKPDPKDTPVVLYPVPLVVAPGEKVKLTLRGQKLDATTEVKAGGDRAKVKMLGKKKAALPNTFPKERVGDTEVEVELELPKDFPSGPLELTAVGPGGASKPYPLTVDGGPRVAEKEPNDSFAQAQELTLPATVDGTIGRERDVDVFRFVGKAGEVVRIEVKAARLGSPLDGLVVLYDANRQVVASCDDADGSPDPVVVVKLPRDGVYFVSLIDAHDLGGPQFGYRLLVTRGR